MQYRNDITEAYLAYKNIHPLDITTKADFDAWKEDYMLDILGYSRIVMELRSLVNIHDLISADYDYDNLFVVLESLRTSGYLSVQNGGELLWNGLIRNNFQGINSNIDIYQTPNTKYNQFPCDLNSRHKRVKLFYDKFPYIEKMNIGVLGDDDLLSIELYKTGIYTPIVYELDREIIDLINKETNGEVKTIQGDILNEEYVIGFDIDTFISDPPYNINGLINFTNFGIRQINESLKEFFLIFNKMMIGKYYYDFLGYLAQYHKTYPLNIDSSFSRYNFPEEYRELIDINKQLGKYGCHFSAKDFSSSSSLFHFKISEFPRKSYSNLIYKRY